MLKIYNSASKQKEIFEPIEKGKVGLYACGMTVYDLCHIGHARALLAFDVVVRYLTYLGYEVTYVRNITDIDDKIIQAANKNHEDYRALTARFIDALHEDVAKLNLLPPTVEPRATENMPAIIDMIQALISKGLAYVGKNGDVFYSVKNFKDYGYLSHRDLEQMQAGARIEVSDAKRDPLDFVLWKLAKPEEPSWDSPWGKGRPGWHAECSAMSIKCLGNHFDIHGGGADLLFPHHENEIAQSEGYTGEKFVNVWMHVGYLQINQEKMSKSLGNFFTIRDVLHEVAPEVLRYFLIACHYRSPLNYTSEALVQSRQALERLYIALRGIQLDGIVAASNTSFEKNFTEAMDDDFNTPKAFAVLFDLAREINRLREKQDDSYVSLAMLLKDLGSILGLLQLDPEQFLQTSGLTDETSSQIEQLIAERNKARAAKDWSRADEIRDQLDQMGVVLEDNAAGTQWRKK